MTDNEIIKALEHCLYKEHRQSKCTECEYVTGCKPYLMREALDLIKRQKAESEDLQDELKCEKETNEHLSGEYISLQKENESQKAEIERLKKAIAVVDIMEEQHKYDLKKAKAEAIKEFVKKFEKKIKDVQFTIGQAWEIQCALKEILKETVGDHE